MPYVHKDVCDLIFFSSALISQALFWLATGQMGILYFFLIFICAMNFFYRAFHVKMKNF